MFEDHWVTAPISLAFYKGICIALISGQYKTGFHFHPPDIFVIETTLITNLSGISPNYLLQFLIGKLTKPRELTLVQPNLEPFQLSREGRNLEDFGVIAMASKALSQSETAKATIPLWIPANVSGATQSMDFLY